MYDIALLVFGALAVAVCVALERQRRAGAEVRWARYWGRDECHTPTAPQAYAAPVISDIVIPLSAEMTAERAVAAVDLAAGKHFTACSRAIASAVERGDFEAALASVKELLDFEPGPATPVDWRRHQAVIAHASLRLIFDAWLANITVDI